MLFGVIEIFVTTVNVPDTEFVPSLDNTVCFPPVVCGTVNIAEKLPEPSDITAPGSVTLFPSKVIEIGRLPANPFPVRVTKVPVGPFTGVIVVFATTLKLFESVFVPSVAEML